MNIRAQRVAFTAVCLITFTLAAGAQLNPTVNVLGLPTGPVPNGCDQSVAQQSVPRVQVAEIPEPVRQKPSAPPPTASLRAQLKDIQAAADRGDRALFTDALLRVKASLEKYPAGGEKDAAREVVRVYDDLDRVWTYQMESPTGAFFDSASAPAQVMRNYPGFERAIADQTFTDSHGTRLYPTTETREFLVREAASRLKTLGVTVATRAPRAPRALPKLETSRAAKTRTAEAKVESKPSTRTAEMTVPKAPSHQKAPVVRHHRRTAKKTAHETRTAEKTTKPQNEAAGVAEQTKPAAKPSAKKAATKVAEKKPAAVEHKEVAAASPIVTHREETPKPVTATTAPALVSSGSMAPATSTAPATPATASETPATASATSSSSTSSAPASSTAMTSSAPATDTTATTATDKTASATDTTGKAGKEPPQSKSVVLPIILIIVGIGVLILLFRASS